MSNDIDSEEKGSSDQEEEKRLRRERKRRRKNLRKDILRVLIIASVFVAAALVTSQFHDIQEIRRLLHSDDSVIDQYVSYFYFIVIGAVLVAFGLPRWVVCVAGGSIYGAVLGVGLAMVTTMTGAMGSYMLGSSLLKSTVKRRLGERGKRFAEKFKENGFEYTLMLRLMPFTNPTLTSMMCGVFRVPLGVYNAANMIGFIPLTLVYTIFGSGATKGKTSQILIGALIFLIFLLFQRIYRKKKQAKAIELEPQVKESI